MDSKSQLPISKGARFGRWTALGEVMSTAAGERKWLCRCDCGTERYVLERSLLYGGSESCGCVRAENALKTISYDLTGKTYGELIALHRAEHQRKNGGVWWTCRCSCGSTYDVPATLLVKGRRTHCPDRSHKRNYASADISGQHFSRLVAQYPTEKRDGKGSVIWHCLCDCGNEVDVPYNSLVYCSMRSCGCQKKENDQKLQDNLAHVDGTSIDAIRSQKIPTSNTTGYRGVYFIRGKYVAKIVFQKKGYYCGAYRNIEDAVKARQEAEDSVFIPAAKHYDLWKKASVLDSKWAETHPVLFQVEKDYSGSWAVACAPDIESIEKILRNGGDET